VLVTFRSADPQQDQQDPTRDTMFYDYPWLRPARISGYGTDREMQVGHFTDADAESTSVKRPKQPLNSAGMEYPERLYAPYAFPSLVIEKDFQTWPDDLESYVNTLNLNTFFGYPKGRWRMLGPRWSRSYTGNGIRYYNITFEFEYDHRGDNGHNGRVLYDKGYWYVNDEGNWERAADDLGNWATSPVFLDGDGGLLDAGLDPINWLTNGWNPYQYRDFALLGLPTDKDGY